MDIDLMQWFIYAIIYKLADDFDDEEVYNIYFPNGKYICYTILIFYTIYLFYFKDITSCIYFNLFILELGYIFFLLVKYLNYSNIIIIGEIKLSLYDPFTLLCIIQLPKFIIYFKKIYHLYFWYIISCFILMICIGIFQDIDNSLLGKYIFKNKYNITPHKKYYKSIYSIFLVLFLCLLYKYCYNDIFKYGILFSISYFGTSVVSLSLQMFLENKIKHIEFIKQLEIIKQKCIITLQD